MIIILDPKKKNTLLGRIGLGSPKSIKSYKIILLPSPTL